MKQTVEPHLPAMSAPFALSQRWSGAILVVLAGLAAPLSAQPTLRDVPAAPAAAAVDTPAGPPRALLDAPPIGRVAAVQGPVVFWDPDARAWTAAELGRPLASGDRISTGPAGGAELQLGSSTLRLHSRSELDLAAFDAAGLSLALRRGSLALRVRTEAAASRLEIVTPEARLVPAGTGHFRVDHGEVSSRDPRDRTQATVWQGRLDVASEQGFRISRGEQVALWRENGQLQHVWGNPAEDAFAERALQDDARDERQDRLATTAPPVALEITGAADLARHGRWDQHPDLGWVWLPLAAQAGWAPYRQGRWTWVHPWGWTWIDNAPWAFATYQGGRWLQWGVRWVWAPYPGKRYAPVHLHVQPPGHPPGHPRWAPREHFLPPGAQQPPVYGPSPRPPVSSRPDLRHPPRRDEAMAPRPDERKDWRMRMPRQEHRLEDTPPQRPLPRPEGRPDQRPEQRPDPRPGPRPSERSAERPAEPPRAAPPAPAPRAPAAEPPQRRPIGGSEPEQEHLR